MGFYEDQLIRIIIWLSVPIGLILGLCIRGKQKTPLSPGYIYVMTNDAMPGLVKIGMTKREPEQRRKELTNETGVPMPFTLAYALKVDNCEKAETIIHQVLTEYRVNKRREFFKIYKAKAIRIVKKYGRRA